MSSATLITNNLHKYAIEGSLPVSVPSTLKAFDDVKFLTTVLRGNGVLKAEESVVSVKQSSLGVPGFVSAVCKLTLTYSEGTQAPATMIGKISGGDLAAEKQAELKASGKADEASAIKEPTGLEAKIMHGLFYPNEIRFFAETSQSLTDARFPSCYFAASRGKAHALLLEDMSFAQFGDVR